MSTEINPTTGIRVDVLGPTVEFLTTPEDTSNDFCVLKGIIPPGVFVPLHSHADTEDFIVISGKVQVLKQNADGYEWVEGKVGDYVHVPGGTHHAWRNTSHEVLTVLVITTRKLTQFFQEVGRPVATAPQPPRPEDIANFMAISDKYGYWNATPEENAAVGIHF